MTLGRSGSPNQFASALSKQARLADAMDETCQSIRQSQPTAPSLTIVFASHHHADAWEELPAGICTRLQTQALMGCSGESIVGKCSEVEEQPALSIWAAWTAEKVFTPIHLEFQNTPEGGAIVGWPDDMTQWPDTSTLLLLAEPFTFPADYLLERLNEDRPGVPVLGGMASGAAAPGENRLFVGTEALSSGAVAVLLDDTLQCSSAVSQGCRPIGEPMVITKADRNVIHELGGVPAMDRLQETFVQLPTREQLMVQHGLHVGRVLTEYQEQFEAGDFLVRNVVGIDRAEGSIAIADFVRAGQTVQFHVRDGQTAHDDLELILSERKKTFAAQAGLLFTCNGRGTRLFSDSDHDARAIAKHFGDIPLAGFFAQGEMGPVGGSNFLHGFTASLALFR